MPAVAADSIQVASAAADHDGDEDLQEVTVTGVRSLVRDKLGEVPLNIPQSLTVISTELISAQGTTRLGTSQYFLGQQRSIALHLDIDIVLDG